MLKLRSAMLSLNTACDSWAGGTFQSTMRCWRRRARGPTDIRQFFVSPIAPVSLDYNVDDGGGLERVLYQIRRAIERSTPDGPDHEPAWYVGSLSSRTITYKGLLRPDQLAPFYRDLGDPEVATGLALVHSRFSTNTISDLVARAPVSLSLPQRRDQHPARQSCVGARA
jgi:glutamate synthase domain-containing protein 1